MENFDNNKIDVKPEEILEDLDFGKENSIREERIVENEELGISYKETILELPKQRQEKFGIKKIKRREVLKYPEKFIGKRRDGTVVMNLDLDESEMPVWEFLTDGRFPSPTVWEHQFNMAHEGEYPVPNVDEFKKQGLFFQEICNEKVKGSDFDVGSVRHETNPNYYEFYTWIGSEIPWPDRNINPVFCFSGKNKNLKSYLEDVKSCPEAVELLESEGWNFDSPHELVDPDSEEFDTIMEEHIEELITTLYKSKSDPEKDEIRKRERKEWLEAKKAGCYAIKKFKTNKSFNSLLQFCDGKPPYPASEKIIPVIRYSKVRPLRWCDSELAIIPTKRGLNVVFFETE